MDSIEFALEMEMSIRKTLDQLRGQCSVRLIPVIDILLETQREFERLLSECPEIEPVKVIGSDEGWRALTNAFNPADSPSADDLAAIWSVHALYDRSAQFYSQAANNAGNPQRRLFYSSMAELKAMLRRKVDGIHRIIANQVWSAVGFPPGQLAKE